MNASKENAVKAKTDFHAIVAALGTDRQNHYYPQVKAIVEFLEDARNKLPSEAAYEREKNRKRTRSKKAFVGAHQADS